MTDYVPPDIDEWSTTSVSEEGLDSLMSLLFSNIVRTGVKVVTMIVFVNQMLLMMAGDVILALVSITVNAVDINVFELILKHCFF